MSLLKKLFGGAEPPAPDPITHAGFTIFPEPVKEDGGYRIAARIEKEVGGDMQVHHMIRADTYAGQETAIEASISKAKQVIDQMGERIFR